MSTWFYSLLLIWCTLWDVLSGLHSLYPPSHITLVCQKQERVSGTCLMYFFPFLSNGGACELWVVTVVLLPGVHCGYLLKFLASESLSQIPDLAHPFASSKLVRVSFQWCSKGIHYATWSNELWVHLFMVCTAMVFRPVVSFVVFASLSKESEHCLGCSVTEPVESHVHGFGSSGLEVSVHYT